MFISTARWQIAVFVAYEDCRRAGSDFEGDAPVERVRIADDC